MNNGTAKAQHRHIEPSTLISQVAVPLGVVEGQALLRVGAGRGELTEIKLGGTESRMGLQQERGLVLAQGQGEALLP